MPSFLSGRYSAVKVRKKLYVTAATAAACGVQNCELADAASRGELVKVERDPYCTSDTWEEGCVVVQHRFARGVFSHDAARCLLGLSDAAPEVLTMSFPRGYNPSSAKLAGIMMSIRPQRSH